MTRFTSSHVDINLYVTLLFVSDSAIIVLYTKQIISEFYRKHIVYIFYYVTQNNLFGVFLIVCPKKQMQIVCILEIGIEKIASVIMHCHFLW